jgi:hypothetical protein
LFFLLVWLPNVSLFLFQVTGKHMTDPNIAICLLVVAGLSYIVSSIFTSEELVKQYPPTVPTNPPAAYGAKQSGFIGFALLPSYLAACLTVGVLANRSVSLFGRGEFPSLVTLLLSALLGAILWGLPFLALSYQRFDRWLWFARTAAGAGFGIALVVSFWLLRGLPSDDDLADRYKVILGLPLFFIAHQIGSILFAGLGSRVQDHDGIREWSARAGGQFALISLAWLVYATLVLLVPDWLRMQFWGDGSLLWHGLMTIAGGAAGIIGALLGKSQSTEVTHSRKSASEGHLGWTRMAQIAGVIFFATLIVELSWLFNHIVSWLCNPLNKGLLLCIAIPLVLAVWASTASYFIHVNKFSLHAFYRNRLIRAYLGASNKKRCPSAFTGFDENDNLKMEKLWPEPGSKTPPASPAPLHVINLALNLVHGKRLAWQDRKASSFTVTSLAAGNPDLGYRPAAEYGGGITLGTAMAISGAALSPNMGYHSSPVLGLLMTLFNVRLGWWLGNPKYGTWDRSGPLQSVGPLLMELFGLTDDTGHYVYLSDGGHFENLGVYEMLRRRCRTIVVIDAGADPDFNFEDLGNAIRKARIDFGVEISFPSPTARKITRLDLVNRPKRIKQAPYHTVLDIKYPEKGNIGKLIYIKPALHGNEPQDIGSYAAANPTFPHETTADQFFSESQFESYRRLGEYIGLKVGAQGAFSNL